LNRLIVTNGKSAVEAITKAGIEGDVLSWDDILHDGPVPHSIDLDELSEVRSEFLSSLGWVDAEVVKSELEMRNELLRSAPARDEVFCWFEHDLYDQLQLWQVLSELSEMNVAVNLICKDEYVGHRSMAELRKDFESRVLLSAEDMNQASQLWSAFRQNDPKKLWELRESEFSFAATAIERWAQTFPACQTGLNRSEWFSLSYLAQRDENATSFGELFRALLNQEEAMFMGDSSFHVLLKRLERMSPSLVQLTNDADLRNATVEITERGRTRLRDDSWAWDDACDRWIGGVELKKDSCWCWDRDQNAFRHETRA